MKHIYNTNIEVYKLAFGVSLALTLISLIISCIAAFDYKERNERNRRPLPSDLHVVASPWTSTTQESDSGRCCDLESTRIIDRRAQNLCEQVRRSHAFTIVSLLACLFFLFLDGSGGSIFTVIICLSVMSMKVVDRSFGNKYSTSSIRQQEEEKAEDLSWLRLENSIVITVLLMLLTAHWCFLIKDKVQFNYYGPMRMVGINTTLEDRYDTFYQHAAVGKVTVDMTCL